MSGRQHYSGGGGGGYEGRGNRGGYGRGGGRRGGFHHEPRHTEPPSFSPPSCALSWCATAGIMEYIDRSVMVIVRDSKGRLQYLYGILTSYNEFGILVLENAYEKIIRGEECAMKRLGATIVRGENVVLVSSINAKKAEDQDATLRNAEFDRLKEEEKAEWKSFEEKARMHSGMGTTAVCGFEDTFY